MELIVQIGTSQLDIDIEVDSQLGKLVGLWWVFHYNISMIGWVYNGL